MKDGKKFPALPVLILFTPLCIFSLAGGVCLPPPKNPGVAEAARNRQDENIAKSGRKAGEGEAQGTGETSVAGNTAETDITAHTKQTQQTKDNARNIHGIQPDENVLAALKTGDEDLIDAACLNQYLQINSDTIGIIKIPGTVLNHPLMRSPQRESFYLNHDILKKSNANGIPFVSLRSRLLEEGGNAVIYGHNIRYGRKDVFYPLSGYKDAAYYKEHPVIELVTAEGKFKFLVFAYFLVDTSDSDAFVYWENTSFLESGVFEAYMKEVKARNWLDTKVPTSSEDSYLTLSSCSMELAHSGTNRMVVMARKEREGESAEIYLENARNATAPLLPEKLRK